MNKLILILIFLSGSFALSAQTLQQEQKEMRRKYNNPYEGQTQKTKTVQTFKLRGYTDSTQLQYSKMASCKMTCLSVDENAIRTVLKEGTVNVSRSDIASPEKVFAVEYDNGEKLRVVVSPRGASLFVITVNPINKKAECDCK